MLNGGEVYYQFRGKPQEAVTFLLAKRGGEAVGALHHDDVGDIDLVWGQEGTGHSDGFGLAKLAKFHPEVLFSLQDILNDMVVTKRSDNRIQLESANYQAAVRLTWNNEKKTWLLTMFEKKNSALDNTTDTGKTLKGDGNDTATPKSTVNSESKGTTPGASAQAPQGESLLNGGELQTDYNMESGSVRRERGYVYDGTRRVDRPGSLDEHDGVVVGANAGNIFFSNKDGDQIEGEFVLVPITAVEPSHSDGRRNPRHFIPEAQPKDEEVTSDVRLNERTKIINNFDPPQIIDSSIAFSGAPVVNERGEVIQGNNRTLVLKDIMHNNNGAVGMMARRAYLDYLRANAREFGFNPEDIRDNHVLVRRVKVSDAEAIRLGSISDLEMTSGGFRPIDGRTAVRKLIAKRAVNAFLVKLFGDEIDSTINESLRLKGHTVMRWLKEMGIITESEYASAIENGMLTKQAKGAIEKMIDEIVTRDASPKQKELWSKLSDQRQANIFYAIMKALNIQNEENRNAFYQSVFKALEIEERARQRKDIPEVKADKKSLVVKWYDTLKTILQQSTLFGEDADIARYTDEDYMLAAVMIANKNANSTELRRVLTGIINVINKSEAKEGRIIVDDAKSYPEAVREIIKGQYGYDMDATDAMKQPTEGFVGRALTEHEASGLIAQMEVAAEVAPQIELTPENWKEQFGESGVIETPIGEVKMGENQLMKMVSLGRNAYFGMVRPTLNNPDVIIEAESTEDGVERHSKYVFVKTFLKPDKSRVVHFVSVTIQRDGLEISISSHEIDARRIKKDMQNGKILHINKKLSPGSEWPLTRTPQAEGPDLVPTSDSFDGKDNKLSSNTQEKTAQVSSEEELDRKLDDYSEALLHYEMKAEHDETEELAMAQLDQEMRASLIEYYKESGMTDQEAVSAANSLMITTRSDVSLEASRRQRNSGMGFSDAYETQEGEVLHRFADDKQDFDRLRQQAIDEMGIVPAGLNEKEVPVVEVKRHPFFGFEPIRQAREWAKKHLRGVYEATDSFGKKFSYTISRTKIDKYLSDTAIKKSDSLGVHLAVLYKLPDIISNSIEVEIHPDFTKENGERNGGNKVNDNVLVHRFYGCAYIDGETYRIKTTILETRGSANKNLTHTYEVTKIELLPESNNSSVERTPPSVRKHIVRATKLLEGVEKSYSPGVKILEESIKNSQKHSERPAQNSEKALLKRTVDDIFAGAQTPENNESPASGRTSGAGQPTDRVNAANAHFDAKVSISHEIAGRFNSLLENLTHGNTFGLNEMLMQICNAISGKTALFECQSDIKAGQDCLEG